MNTDTKNLRNLPPDFLFYLDLKSRDLIRLYGGLRSFLLDVYPDASELLYHTHALTSLYTITDKMSMRLALEEADPKQLKAGQIISKIKRHSA